MTAIEPAARAVLDFAELVRAHESMVFSLAYHFLHDRDAAEEVAQEVFLSLHESGADPIRGACRILAAESGGAAGDR